MSLLYESNLYEVKRHGRHVIARFKAPCATEATSFVQGGRHEDLEFAVNHQCVEGKLHQSRGEAIHALGQESYHEQVCRELEIPPPKAALLSTAASMLNCAVKVEKFKELEVCALVTAGVQGNAGRAGDPATWHEEDAEWERLHREAGTINIMLLINWPLSPGALSRALVTATEAKSAALWDLAIPGKYSPELATGTGTDQMVVVAPLDPGKKPKNWSGKHSKLGELIGKSVHAATLESLRWQNGLEASHTRSVYHALGRFGFTREDFFDHLKKELSSVDFDLLGNNEKAVMFDPQVSAAAFSLAAVWDRLAKEVFPEGAKNSIWGSHAALLACQVAGKPELYGSFLSVLTSKARAPLELIYHSFALGWREKWKP